MMKRLLVGLAALFLSTFAAAQSWRDAPPLLNNVGTVNPATCTVGQLYFRSDLTAGQNIMECTATNTWTQQGGGTGTVTSVGWTGGIVSIATPTTTPAFTIAGTSGGIPYFSNGTTWASSAALAANALVIGGGAGVAPATTTTGTGVLTALGVNTGSAGAFVVNGGALGTPSSGTLTSATGLPISTGLTGAGAGVLTALGNATNGAGGFIVTDGTATLTNKTYDTAGTGNVFKINGNSFVNTNCDSTHFVRGDGTCQTVSASSTLNGITAATGGVTIASGNNTGIVWNWAITTDATTAHTYGETSAATGGTANNQSLFDISTTTSSTAVPLRILQLTPTATIPSALFSTAAASATTSPALAMRFSRGTIASPTVITTGDRLGYVSGQGFVGATNKFLEATRIEMDSTGTIADATTGVGGIIKFMTTKAGTDSAVQEAFRAFGGSVPQVQFQNGAAATPVITFAAQTTDGFYSAGAGTIGFAIGGSQTAVLTGSNMRVPAGSGTVPGLTDVSTTNSGLSFNTVGALSLLSSSKETTRLDANGHINMLAGGAQTAAPTVTANCGSSPTVTGNDSAFVLNVGTGGTATTCTITFNKTFTNAPHCFAQDQTQQAITTTVVPSTSTVILTTGTAWTASSKIDVFCIGHL